MPTYNYVLEHGAIVSRTEIFKWQSLCHNENIMDECNMLVEIGGFGWSICRLCGKEASFIKRWPK